jgi:rhomboid protease GluP
MQNDPPPERKRRVHPLLAEPEPLEGEEDGKPPRQRMTLHIPVVTPRVTYTLMAVNVIIFFLAFYVMSAREFNDLYRWGWSTQREVFEFGEFHRLVTSMFLHANLAHLFFNMYALWAIGQNVERFFGHVRFALVYFLGGLGGSILYIMLSGADTPAVGASGAIFAIFGAEMVFLYQHRKLFGKTGQAQLRQLIIVAGINFVYGFAQNAAAAPGEPQIGNWAHVGGLIGGIIVAWMIAPFFLLKKHPENPMGLAVDDINPLERRYQPLLAYVSALLAILVVGSVLAR